VGKARTRKARVEVHREIFSTRPSQRIVVVTGEIFGGRESAAQAEKARFAVAE
jgi:hypothetical protein